ncbi:hypothetical protein HC891_01670 [Candidatus Gracilibacteria bacterium]|nr:hypothetical protein [Candidatus Gracilibacteria bacterium]
MIDARGRPLALPQDDRERCLKFWEWLVALGAERGANPYVGAAAPPEARMPLVVEAMPTPSVSPVSEAPATRSEALATSGEVVASGGGKRISLAELAAQEPATNNESATGSLDKDLARLRESVEAPKKRGLFGRKGRACTSREAGGFARQNHPLHCLLFGYCHRKHLLTGCRRSSWVAFGNALNDV